MPCGDDLCKHNSALYPHSRIRADAAALLGRSPPTLLIFGYLRRARPRKLSAFPDCRAFALSAKSSKSALCKHSSALYPHREFALNALCILSSQNIRSLITQEKEMSASQPLPFLLRLLYNIPLYLHNYYFTESFS